MSNKIPLLERHNALTEYTEDTFFCVRLKHIWKLTSKVIVLFYCLWSFINVTVDKWVKDLVRKGFESRVVFYWTKTCFILYEGFWEKLSPLEILMLCMKNVWPVQIRAKTESSKPTERYRQGMWNKVYSNCFIYPRVSFRDGRLSSPFQIPGFR